MKKTKFFKYLIAVVCAGFLTTSLASCQTESTETEPTVTKAKEDLTFDDILYRGVVGFTKKTALDKETFLSTRELAFNPAQATLELYFNVDIIVGKITFDAVFGEDKYSRTDNPNWNIEYYIKDYDDNYNSYVLTYQAFTFPTPAEKSTKYAVTLDYQNTRCDKNDKLYFVFYSTSDVSEPQITISNFEIEFTVL